VNGAEVIILRTGTANLASVAAAFTRLGARPRISHDPALAAEAPLLVLPGVGAFGAAMSQLRADGLDELLRERVRPARPLLAICLGLQLLCESSEESPGVMGLGVVPGRITRFRPDQRVPQMGWNRIAPTPGASLLQSDWMYFANSFRLESVPDGWSGAVTDYGGTFAAALERGPILACQFHPELSGAAGLALLTRWLTLASASESIAC
jgi:imidazole glycerol phosphate synthase glutamine amidotransferase subunit